MSGAVGHQQILVPKGKSGGWQGGSMPFMYVPSLVTPLLWGMCSGIGSGVQGKPRTLGIVRRSSGGQAACGGAVAATATNSGCKRCRWSVTPPERGLTPRPIGRTQLRRPYAGPCGLPSGCSSLPWRSSHSLPSALIVASP